mmetsp:Transcript_68400/g.187457  ORF Transcript_68400/g.187457 Transcript_68400/m.187457 type:complete len:217 (-) Transcript_68400:933-1583(-)
MVGCAANANFHDGLLHFLRGREELVRLPSVCSRVGSRRRRYRGGGSRRRRRHRRGRRGGDDERRLAAWDASTHCLRHHGRRVHGRTARPRRRCQCGGSTDAARRRAVHPLREPADLRRRDRQVNVVQHAYLPAPAIVHLGRRRGVLHALPCSAWHHDQHAVAHAELHRRVTAIDAAIPPLETNTRDPADVEACHLAECPQRCPDGDIVEQLGRQAQ